jgi:hypothetical protein
VDDIYLPDRGALSAYTRRSRGPSPRRYRRVLPNVLSRALECTILAGQFDGDVPLLVLGDVPLGCTGRQVVFLQTAHFATGSPAGTWSGEIKNAVGRWLFRLNLARVDAFVAQSETMKAALEASLPATRGRVRVIAQPAPQWLLDANLHRSGRVQPTAEGLDLVYPAARYPYKNHALLGSISGAEAADWPVRRLLLTIPPSQSPNPAVEWIDCVGVLDPRGMLGAYASSDGLLYLSRTESYGLPLVEAMHVGLPVVCPDLAYARTLCGETAIYFDPDRAESLRAAVTELSARLRSGWWPDWSDRLDRLPKTWSEVANAFVAVTCDGP